MSDTQAQDVVETFLNKTKAAVSEGDVAAGTGLDVSTAKRALYALMRTHRASIEVRDDGTLVYDFGAKLTPLGRRSWGERLRHVGRALWRGFSWVYKASLAIILVTYAVTFVVLIIGAAIAASAASKDEAPARRTFHLTGAIFRAIFEMSVHNAPVLFDVDRRGYRVRRYAPRPAVFRFRSQKTPTKSFIQSVYDFVLGPPRVDVDPRAQHKEVAAFVRKNGGVLTVADIQALSGMSRERAEQFFARFVAELDGEAVVTDDGALFARFDELMRSKSDAGDAEIVLYWDEYEPPYEVTGNTVGRNLAIMALAGFNLVCAGFVVSIAQQLGPAGIWLGAVPATIFALFFAIPAVRAPVVLWKNRQQHRTNIRKRVFKAIFGAHEEKLAFDEVIARANQAATTEEPLHADALRGLLEETLEQIGATLDVDTRDKLVMDLRQLRRESQAGAQHKVEVERAEVVYSSNP